MENLPGRGAGTRRPRGTGATGRRPHRRPGTERGLHVAASRGGPSPGARGLDRAGRGGPPPPLPRGTLAPQQPHAAHPRHGGGDLRPAQCPRPPHGPHRGHRAGVGAGQPRQSAAGGTGRRSGAHPRGAQGAQPDLQPLLPGAASGPRLRRSARPKSAKPPPPHAPSAAWRTTTTWP